MSDQETHQPPAAGEEPTTHTRRRVLKAAGAGLVAVLGAGFAGLELVDHNVLPGHHWLEVELGDCSVPAPPLTYLEPGPVQRGSFFSRARNRVVGYQIAYPPGHGPGDRLPLGVFLHGEGGDHQSGIGDVSLAKALAGRLHGLGLPPIALAAADGGHGYWNPHPGDNPQAMIVEELIPMCQRRGLGRGPERIGTIGLSMGGYGALLIAERYPQLVAAVAAISPAIWTTYAQARAVNAGAYASAADFARDDVVTHASALAATPVRIASGNLDPFHSGVVAMAKAAPKSVIVEFSPGCHSSPFFSAQQHPSLAFLAKHLA